MTDRARKWTEAELKRLEKQIKAEYTKAYAEMKKEMADIMSKISISPDLPLGKKMVLMNKYDRLNTMSQQMAEILANTNRTATSFVEKSMQNMFKMNYNLTAEQLRFSMIDNTAVKNILAGEVNPFTKLSIQGEVDKALLKRTLQSELTTGLLKGDSIQNMSKRLKAIAEKNLKNTVRIARTETTRIEGSAKQSVADAGAKQGFDTWKRWVATDGERTRPEHSDADGEEVPYDEPFTVGGEKLMYPADISMGASAWNVINCRCTMIVFVKEK